MIYIGRQLSKDKLIYCYYEYDDLGVHEDRQYTFKTPLLKFQIIGSIITANQISASTFNNFKLVDVLKDLDKITIWSRNDNANVLKYKSQSNLKTVPDDEYDKILKILQGIYNRIDNSNKDAFLFRLTTDIKNNYEMIQKKK